MKVNKSAERLADVVSSYTTCHSVVYLSQYYVNGRGDKLRMEPVFIRTRVKQVDLYTALQQGTTKPDVMVYHSDTGGCDVTSIRFRVGSAHFSFTIMEALPEEDITNAIK
jgi:hypothetical protein